MTKGQIQKGIKEMDAYLPVSKIEELLGMPPTTLQKVLSGKRKLPKKWLKVLEGYLVSKDDKKTDLPKDKKEKSVPKKNNTRQLELSATKDECQTRN